MSIAKAGEYCQEYIIRERESVLLSYGAYNSCCMRFSKSMIFTNSFKFMVYIVGTAARAKVSNCIVMKCHLTA